MTITVPENLGNSIRKEARAQKKPVSRVVVEALEAQERERVRQRMIEGYKAMAEENERLAEEWAVLDHETLPDD